MRKKSRVPVPAFGASALLVTFAVLCLTVFSLLSLSTALAQKRLADASVQTVQAYYEADLQAEEIFARLRSGETVAGVQAQGKHYCYRCTVTEYQTLEVELQRDGEQWQICRWQVVTQSIPISETLPVWDGK